MSLADTKGKLELYVGLVATIGGMAAAVRTVAQEWQGLSELLGQPLAWAYAAVLAAGIALTWHSQLKRSKLLKPDALRLDRRRLDHLIGREDDIERLETLCTDRSLVFFEGESGSGKSALILSGILPHLRARPYLFPLYIDAWGQDWERGPAQAIARALWEGVKDGERAQLGVTAPPTIDALSDLLTKIGISLGRKPILIFDQFDDYQAQHRELFLPSETKEWLPSDHLCARNKFWYIARDLLKRDIVQCVFVTRTDNRGGLESVHFEDQPACPRLERLKSIYIEPLLDRLTRKDADDDVIENPSSGWQRLRRRLAQDLSRESYALPQQIKVALGGLQGLPYLTVAAYERAGGLLGLEALYVETQLDGVASRFNIAASDIRNILTRLVNPLDPIKTIARPLEDLVDPDARYTRGQMEEVFADLALSELLLKRIDPETNQSVWQLDHDYLTRGLFAAVKRANRWEYLLSEGANAFRDAGSSLVGRWRALPTPWFQLQILYARLTGRMTYGEHVNYALLGLLRFAPISLIAAFAFAGWTAYADLRNTEEAQEFVRRFDFPTEEGEFIGIKNEDVDRLWALSDANDTVRRRFLAEGLRNPIDADRVSRYPSLVMRAVVGVDLGLRDRLLAETTFSDAAATDDRRSGNAAVELITELADADAATKAQFDFWLTKLEHATDQNAIYALATGLARMSDKLGKDLDASQAERAYSALTAKMSSTDGLVASGIGDALASVSTVEGKPELASRALNSLCGSLYEATSVRISADQEISRSILTLVGHVGGALDVRTTGSCLEKLLSRMSDEGHQLSFDYVEASAALAGVLQENLDGKTLDNALEGLLNRHRSGSSNDWVYFAIRELVLKSASHVSPKVAGDVFSQACKEENESDFYNTTVAVIAFADESTQQFGADAVTQCLTSVLRRLVEGGGDITDLPLLINQISSRLSPRITSDAYNAVLGKMMVKTDGWDRVALASMLQSLGGAMGDNLDSQTAADSVLAMTGNIRIVPHVGHRLDPVRNCIAMLAPRVHDALVTATLTKALEALRISISSFDADDSDDNSGDAAELGDTIAAIVDAFGRRASTDTLRSELVAMINQMQRLHHASSIGAASKGITAIVKLVRDPSLGDEYGHALADLTPKDDDPGAYDYFVRSVLADGLKQVGSMMDPKVARSVLARVEEMRQDEGKSRRLELAEIVATLPLSMQGDLNEQERTAAFDDLYSQIELLSTRSKRNEQWALEGGDLQSALVSAGEKLKALSPLASDVIATKARSAALATIGTARTSKVALSFSKVLVEYSKSMSFDDFARQVFQVLQYPTLGEEATNYLVGALAAYPHSTASYSGGFWGAVKWATSNGLVTAPERPEQP